MLDLILPSFDVSSFNFPGLPTLSSIYVNWFQFNIELRLLKVKVAFPGTLPVIPKILTVTDLRFLILVGRRPPKSVVGVQGTVTMGNSITATVRLIKKASGFLLSGQFLDDISIPSLSNQFGVSFDSLSSFLPDDSPLFGFAIQRPFLEATFAANSTLTSISFAGAVAIRGFPQTQVKVVFLEPSDKKKKAMVVGLEMAAGTLSRILQTATSGLLDISGLPGLGELKFSRLGLTVATKSVTFPSNFKLSDKTLSNLTTVKKGVMFSFDYKISGNLQRLQLFVQSRTNFAISTGRPLSLKDIVVGLFPSLSTDTTFTTLSQVIPGVFDLAVSRLAYNGTQRVFTIAAILQKLTIVPGHVELKKLEVVGSITARPRSQTTLSFTLGGDRSKFNFLGFSLRASIAYNSASRSYSITLTTADSDRVSLGDFTKKISPLNLDSNPVATALNLDKVAIVEPWFQLASSRGLVIW